MKGASTSPVTFRPLSRGDFPVLREWLEEPLVKRWWNHETTAAALERDFGPALDGDDAAELHVAAAGQRAFGLAQRYAIAAYADYLEELRPLYPIPPGALSIDYLIGDPAFRGRGLGAAMITAYVADCWAAHANAREIVVPVASGNRASWRALERAGFARVAEGELEPDNPIDPPDHVVYAIRRPPA